MSNKLRSHAKKRCIVPGCMNDDINGTFSFHHFPKDEKLRKLWTTNMGIPNLVCKPSMYLCSAHFTNDCFERHPGIFALLKASVSKAPAPALAQMRTTLKRGAVPTHFEYALEIKPQSCALLVTQTSPTTIAPTAAKNIKRKENTTIKKKNVISTRPHTPKRKGYEKQNEAKLEKENEAQLQVGKKNAACQATSPVSDKACQTDFSLVHPVFEAFAIQEFPSENSHQGDFPIPSHENHTLSELGQEYPKTGSQISTEEKKHLVFESSLLELFELCFECHLQCTVTTSTSNSLLNVKAVCENGHSRVWNSRPLEWNEDVVDKPCGE